MSNFPFEVSLFKFSSNLENIFPTLLLIIIYSENRNSSSSRINCIKHEQALHTCFQCRFKTCSYTRTTCCRVSSSGNPTEGRGKEGKLDITQSRRNNHILNLISLHVVHLSWSWRGLPCPPTNLLVVTNGLCKGEGFPQNQEQNSISCPDAKSNWEIIIFFYQPTSMDTAETSCFILIWIELRQTFWFSSDSKKDSRELYKWWWW